MLSEILSTDELSLAKQLAAGDQPVKADAEAIYRKHVTAYIASGRKSVAMNFLSECFQVSPDLTLRARYRKQLLEQ